MAQNESECSIGDESDVGSKGFNHIFGEEFFHDILGHSNARGCRIFGFELLHKAGYSGEHSSSYETRYTKEEFVIFGVNVSMEGVIKFLLEMELNLLRDVFTTLHVLVVISV